ncbi:Sulfite exporter TauE/SafE [compost metagenome]
MDWKLLLIVTAAAVLGIFIGNAINKKMPAERLKKWFGWFVLIMGIYIIVKELLFSQSM